ncbi:hypothetical protein F5Y04DRAFT_293148 [Hypomontagnella monticulosa]|nr:hypothetical protein F5Y04DRAFT_293148 [Hypomontagnella monticulosa]
MALTGKHLARAIDLIDHHWDYFNFLFTRRYEPSIKIPVPHKYLCERVIKLIGEGIEPLLVTNKLIRERRPQVWKDIHERMQLEEGCHYYNRFQRITRHRHYRIDEHLQAFLGPDFLRSLPENISSTGRYGLEPWQARGSVNKYIRDVGLPNSLPAMMYYANAQAANDHWRMGLGQFFIGLTSWLMFHGEGLAENQPPLNSNIMMAYQYHQHHGQHRGHSMYQHAHPVDDSGMVDAHPVDDSGMVDTYPVDDSDMDDTHPVDDSGIVDAQPVDDSGMVDESIFGQRANEDHQTRHCTLCMLVQQVNIELAMLRDAIWRGYQHPEEYNRCLVAARDFLMFEWPLVWGKAKSAKERGYHEDPECRYTLPHQDNQNIDMTPKNTYTLLGFLEQLEKECLLEQAKINNPLCMPPDEQTQDEEVDKLIRWWNNPRTLFLGDQETIETGQEQEQPRRVQPLKRKRSMSEIRKQQRRNWYKMQRGLFR